MKLQLFVVIFIAIGLGKFYSVFYVSKGQGLGKEQWIDFWHRATDPFWHLSSEIHPSLLKHGKELDGSRVFVPLCGAALEVNYLAKKHESVGIEFSAAAIERLLDEAKLEYNIEKTKVEGLLLYKAKNSNVSVYQGDLYRLNSDVAGKFDGVWDRASLIAIAPSTRQKYADTIMELLKPGGKVLLVTFEYNQNEAEGPPFSVCLDDVEEMYGTRAKVELIDRTKKLSMEVSKRGIKNAEELTFLITKK